MKTSEWQHWAWDYLSMRCRIGLVTIPPPPSVLSTLCRSSMTALVMWKKAFSKRGYYRCLCEGPSLPSAVAGPCLWAASRWKGKRCTAWQKHTTAASFCDLPRPSAASPGPLSPRWRRTGSGWSDGRCCGCCWAPVRLSSRWSCSGRCGIRPGVPSSLCSPPPLSHQIPPRWTTGLTSWSMRNAPCRIATERGVWFFGIPGDGWLIRVKNSCGVSPKTQHAGLGCGRWAGWDVSSTMGAGGGCCSTLSLLRLRRALVDAYVFSRFYWPAAAADARGGGAERGRRGGVTGELYCTDEGEESGFSIFFFFFSFDRSGRWPLPACRAADAGAGSWPRSWTQSQNRGEDALLSVIYGPLTSCSGAPKMAATGSVWFCQWNGEHCGVHKLRLQMRRRQNSRTTPVSWRGGWGNHKASAARCLPVGSWWRHWFLQCVASLSGNWIALQPRRLFIQESWKGIYQSNSIQAGVWLNFSWQPAGRLLHKWWILTLKMSIFWKEYLNIFSIL